MCVNLRVESPTRYLRPHPWHRKQAIATAHVQAAIAAGADDLRVEMHPRPEEALSDGFQSILPHESEEFMNQIRPYLKLEGKEIQHA